MESDLPKIHYEDFDAETIKDGNDLMVILKGDIGMEDPNSILEPFFEEIHNRVVSQTEQVTVNVKDLKFMNSSGIKSILRWISMISRSENPYKLLILCNRNYTWQRSTFSVIQKVAPKIVTIQD